MDVELEGEILFPGEGEGAQPILRHPFPMKAPVAKKGEHPGVETFFFGFSHTQLVYAFDSFY